MCSVGEPEQVLWREEEEDKEEEDEEDKEEEEEEEEDRRTRRRREVNRVWRFEEGTLGKCKFAINILSMQNNIMSIKGLSCSVSLSIVTVIVTESYCNTTIALYKHGGD